jgi:hypothetical protein
MNQSLLHCLAKFWDLDELNRRNLTVIAKNWDYIQLIVKEDRGRKVSAESYWKEKSRKSHAVFILNEKLESLHLSWLKYITCFFY